MTGAVLDLSRSKSDLIAENALLRHQLVLLKRSIKRPTLKPTDRLSLLLLAKVTRTWRQVLFIVQPATLLRWHREGFRLFWRLKSKPIERQPRLPAETIGLIRQMAKENPLWGAERIRGELLKLGIHVSKQTVQRYRSQKPTPRQSRMFRSPVDLWSAPAPPRDYNLRGLFQRLATASGNWPACAGTITTRPSSTNTRQNPQLSRAEWITSRISSRRLSKSSADELNQPVQPMVASNCIISGLRLAEASIVYRTHSYSTLRSSLHFSGRMRKQVWIRTESVESPSCHDYHKSHTSRFNSLRAI